MSPEATNFIMPYALAIIAAGTVINMILIGCSLKAYMKILKAKREAGQLDNALLKDPSWISPGRLAEARREHARLGHVHAHNTRFLASTFISEAEKEIILKGADALDEMSTFIHNLDNGVLGP